MYQKVNITQIKVKSIPDTIDFELINELSNSIQRNGLIHPITIDNNFNLISGYKRLVSHYILGKTHIDCKINENEDGRLTNIEENLLRVSHNVLELGKLLSIRQGILEELNLHTKQGDNRHTLHSRPAIMAGLKNISKSLNLSERTIYRYKKIYRDIIPELREYLNKTEFSNNVNDLEYISRLTNKIQYKIYELIQKYKKNNLKSYIDKAKKKVRIEDTRREIDKIKKIPDLNDNPYINLYNEDFNSNQLEDCSIDIIFTDPPYLKEYTQLYQNIAKQSKRLLKNKGSIFVYCEKYNMHNVIEIFRKYLYYQWLLILRHNTSVGYHTGDKLIYTQYKPLLWFSKTIRIKKPYKIPVNIRDTIETPYSSVVDTKSIHNWAQSNIEADYILSNLTETNDVLLDPYMGTGTSIISGLNCGLKVYGYEIDEKTYNVSQYRINELINQK